MKNSGAILTTVLAMFVLAACEDQKDISPTHDVLKVINTDEESPQPFVAHTKSTQPVAITPAPEVPAAAAATSASPENKALETSPPVETYAAEVRDDVARDDGSRSTECFPTGVSATHFHIEGRDATVTFVRANYFVALAKVDVHDGATRADYEGEVEIILPEQSRVYNITKNSAYFLGRDNGQFAFMSGLVRNALNERYLICARQLPSAFWRPKDIPEAPRAEITPP